MSRKKPNPKSKRKFYTSRCRLCRNSVPPTSTKNGLCPACQSDPGTVWLARHKQRPT